MRILTRPTTIISRPIPLLAPLPAPGGHYMPNGDVNWLNPPVLTSISPVSIANTNDILYTFKHINLAAADAFYFNNCSNVEVSNCLITNVGNRGLYFLACSGITIRNCKILDTNGNVVQYEGHSIYLDQCGNDVLVESCWFENTVAGVLGNDCSNVSNYRIRGNYCKNPVLNPAGGTGNFVAFNYSYGIADLIIDQNVLNGTSVAECSVEDWISLYQSSGTAASSILVDDNKVKGSGASDSGGGFLSGDTTGVGEFAGYVTISNNRLVDPGQYGLGIAGGHHNIITGNDVFSSYTYALSASGAKPNVGIYLWRQGSSDPGDCHSCEISNNKVLWWSNFAGQPPVKHGSYLPLTGYDGGLNLEPNHGTLVSGNVDPTGWATNDFEYTAWDADSGNQGYTDLPVPDAWAHFPPS